MRHADGLHARPAELVARLAMRFESAIRLMNGSVSVDAKSILEVLTLGAQEGVEIVVDANGSDAQDAVEAIVTLLESDFTAEAEATEQAEESGG